MPHFHIKRITMVVALLLAVASLPQAALASSELLEKYRAVCKQNVQCSAEMTDRGLLFKLRTPQRTKQLLCGNDGVCDVLTPRTSLHRITDAASWLAAE